MPISSTFLELVNSSQLLKQKNHNLSLSLNALKQKFIYKLLNEILKIKKKHLLNSTAVHNFW